METNSKLPPTLSRSSFLREASEDLIDWRTYPEGLCPPTIPTGKLGVLLSIGFASCHFCHKMSLESFRDEEVAKLINEHFVAVKIDREEHPLLDFHFQELAAKSSGKGGWPLNIFLNQDYIPMFIGTYFPKNSTDQISGFKDIITHLVNLLKERPEEVKKVANDFHRLLQTKETLSQFNLQNDFPHPQAIFQAVSTYIDKENGGFGKAPKFPQFYTLLFILEQTLEGTIKPEQGQFAIHTLKRMLAGGIFDQIRGGIHRYSIDSEWNFPHFEKMLYDQAGLLSCLSKAMLLDDSILIEDALVRTLKYLSTEMNGEQYLFTSQHADSYLSDEYPFMEGAFYLSTPEELQNILIENFSELEQNELKKFIAPLSPQYQSKVTLPAGFVLFSLVPEEVHNAFSDEQWSIILRFKEKIRQLQSDRTPPATDTKGVASWNFVLLTALCDVVQYTPLLDVRSFAFDLLSNKIQQVFSAFIRPIQGKSHIFHTTSLISRDSIALLEDYGHFLNLNLRLYELTSNDVFLKNAEQTAHYIQNTFLQKTEDKTFFLAHAPSEEIPLLAGSFPITAHTFDQSIPSPSATIVYALKRLQLLSSDTTLVEAIKLTLNDVVPTLKQYTLNYPVSHGTGLRALTYPSASYKKLEVPKHFINEPSFARLLGRLSPRIVVSYTSPSSTWKIGSETACEHSGESLASLIEKLSPPS